MDDFYKSKDAMNTTLRLSLILFSLFSAGAESNTETYHYDDLGRLFKVQDSKGKTVNYQYDAAGNRKKVELESSSGGSVPGTPTNLKVVSERCFGNNSLYWTKASGTVQQYEVWASTNSSFSSPYRLKTSTSTGSFINVPSTRYVKVKACNTSGCGSYSNQVTARYFGSCL
ncbi:RHS repeat domain-containing protein [uncultured Shewanella sp.]|uniref:RHS repeat domain-containing protein n=1 Tax=uncultured Shewanella sp. TaxID=173975 RepID=UPI0026189153|nr:RHS repeat domain-containing protein [uncultured Shewanella sp.]